VEINMDMHVNNDRFMINELAKSVTKDGRPFIKGSFLNAEGNFYNGIMFDSNKLMFEPKVGDIVAVKGVLQQYSGQTQLKISSMVKDLEADGADFLPKSPYDPQEMLEEMKSLLYENVKTDYLVKLLDKFFSEPELIENFTRFPAAKSVHHAYISGLLEHTLGIVKLCVLTADHYSEKVNKEHLLFGALFHDIGKTKELDSGLGFEYTDSGKLMGHLVLGIDIVRELIDQIDDFPEEVKNLIMHMIAGHHGLLEFGSPIVPKTPEAILLHYIDNIDAKMNTIYSIFEKEEMDGGSWSGYDRLLERQLYKHNFLD